MAERTLADLHREVGRVQERMHQLRINACSDPELVEAVRAKAWMEHGLPEGTAVTSDGNGWVTGLPEGWPEGVDADTYTEWQVGALLGDDDGD